MKKNKKLENKREKRRLQKIRTEQNKYKKEHNDNKTICINKYNYSDTEHFIGKIRMITTIDSVFRFIENYEDENFLFCMKVKDWCLCPICGSPVYIKNANLHRCENYYKENKQHMIDLSKSFYNSGIRFIREFPYPNYYDKEIKGKDYNVHNVIFGHTHNCCYRADYLVLYNNRLAFVEHDGLYHTRLDIKEKDNFKDKDVLNRFGIPVLRITVPDFSKCTKEEESLWVQHSTKRIISDIKCLSINNYQKTGDFDLFEYALEMYFKRAYHFTNSELKREQFKDYYRYLQLLYTSYCSNDLCERNRKSIVEELIDEANQYIANQYIKIKNEQIRLKEEELSKIARRLQNTDSNLTYSTLPVTNEELGDIN